MSWRRPTTIESATESRGTYDQVRLERQRPEPDDPRIEVVLVLAHDVQRTIAIKQRERHVLVLGHLVLHKDRGLLTQTNLSNLG